MCRSVSRPLLHQILLTFLVWRLDFMNWNVGCLLVNNQQGKGHGITDKGSASVCWPDPSNSFTAFPCHQLWITAQHCIRGWIVAHLWTMTLKKLSYCNLRQIARALVVLFSSHVSKCLGSYTVSSTLLPPALTHSSTSVCLLFSPQNTSISPPSVFFFNLYNQKIFLLCPFASCAPNYWYFYCKWSWNPNQSHCKQNFP